MILNACNTNKEYSQAVVQTRIVQAPTILPGWPEYCSKEMAGVVPKLNEPVWGTQARWNIILSNENQRIEWCDKFYNQLKDNLANAVVPN